jgi:hypothetical protein
MRSTGVAWALWGEAADGYFPADWRRRAARAVLGVVLAIASQGCGGSVWNARVCASNASGNCRGVDNGLPHTYPVKSSSIGPLHGTSDVAVKDPSCTNGIGEVDVEVDDADNLKVTLYCLVDAPGGTMTLPAARHDAPAPAPSAH